MTTKLSVYLSLLAAALTSVMSSPSFAATGPAAPLARKALSEDAAEAATATAELRNMGPRGLDLLFETYADQIKRYLAEPASSRASSLEWRRLASALDSVSRQRDSYTSHLYWYTDLEQAKAAARAAGKPILSLRLLGNLDEELSCANSRFFRAVLYANKEVSAALRDRFVLHWKSVRPAPHVTIDFGDGRKIETTVTGNSIHYVLDIEGRPVDAIPGLYGPKAFLAELMQGEAAFRSSSQLTGSARVASLRSYHEGRIRAIADQFQADQTRAGVHLDQEAVIAEPDDRSGPPTARQAAPVAATKSTMAWERKTLRLIGEGAILPSQPSKESDISAWEKIAALHSADASLDSASIAMVRSQYPSADYDNAAISRIIRNLERYIALDTVRNEYVIHATLHRWLAGDWANRDLDSLNEQVYSRLFLTPRSDPWLGLAPIDTYSGIFNNGIKK